MGFLIVLIIVCCAFPALGGLLLGLVIIGVPIYLVYALLKFLLACPNKSNSSNGVTKGTNFQRVDRLIATIRELDATRAAVDASNAVAVSAARELVYVTETCSSPTTLYFCWCLNNYYTTATYSKLVSLGQSLKYTNRYE